MKAVLDTNVLVSALLRNAGHPNAILNLVLNRKLVLCYDSRIMLEYEDVLHRPRFQFNPELVDTLLGDIRNNGLSFLPSPLFLEFNDEEDRAFYETAKSASCLLITGNKRHYPDDPIVLSPAEFIASYSNQAGYDIR